MFDLSTPTHQAHFRRVERYSSELKRTRLRGDVRMMTDVQSGEDPIAAIWSNGSTTIVNQH
jgi:hypothetical protein